MPRCWGTGVLTLSRISVRAPAPARTGNPESTDGPAQTEPLDRFAWNLATRCTPWGRTIAIIWSISCGWPDWLKLDKTRFKLCFIIAAAANLLKPSRMFPPINYQLSVMKYLYLLWPLVHICMTDLRKLHILHFCPSGNTIKRTVAVKVGCLNFGKKSDVTVEPVRTVKTFTELL